MFERLGGLYTDQMAMPIEQMLRQRVLCLYGGLVGAPDRLDSMSLEWVMECLMLLAQESTEPIKLLIDSPGGRVWDSFGLIDVIHCLRTPVWTIGRMCASMAAVVLSAGEPGHRYLYKHSQVMLHLPSGHVGGDSRDVNIQARELQKAQDAIVNELVDNGVRAGHEQVLKDIDREFWMNAQEAIAYGIADSVL